MIQHGFVRVAAAVPRLRVADCDGNAAVLRALLALAEARQLALECRTSESNHDSIRS